MDRLVGGGFQCALRRRRSCAGRGGRLGEIRRRILGAWRKLFGCPGKDRRRASADRRHGADRVRLATAALILVLTATPVRAEPDLAFGAYQRGYYQTAFAEAMKRLEKNSHDAAAMTLVAELEAQGLGVPQNMSEALRWYRLAAVEGDKNAQFALALSKLAGKGGPRDLAGARELLEKAGAQNHAGAWLQLGILALEGNGVAADFGKAAENFRRAAELADPEAAYSLGLLYREGRGVEKDPQQTAYWLKRAAEGGFLAAQVEYGILLFNGDGVPADEPGGAKWLIRAANRDNPVAQNRLARILFAGRGLKQDRVEAAKWNILAASAGLRDARLDGESNKLTPDERKKVEQALKTYLGK
ncbi:sel1 repeat family protein [Rhodoblastus acidophilus]|uniref:Sel1 repeat family protein n=1 Tax=Rhodoblastus acidophilus TaxID=1074 RepID=A0A6N8DJJ0_RHOAC|nr:sel1 repeat family protein [Rhodoblastus acidophilus]